MSATDARLTAADRALLRAVFAWARSNGWRCAEYGRYDRQWSGTVDDAPVVNLYWPNYGDNGEDNYGNAALRVYFFASHRYRCISVPGATVREAVDILAALGVLPPELSSQWQAGRDAALTGYEWRVMCTADGMRRSYPEPQVWTSNIATEADARLELSVAVSEGAWGEPFIQRRRVGASEWERVTPS